MDENDCYSSNLSICTTNVFNSILYALTTLLCMTKIVKNIYVDRL